MLKCFDFYLSSRWFADSGCEDAATLIPVFLSRLCTRILVYAQVQDPPQQGIDIEQFLIFYTGRIRMQLLVNDTEPSANKWRFKILIRVRIPEI